MKLGVGLPNTLAPYVDRALLLDWARAADQAGLHSLGVIDKPNYDSWDPLISLAAAAAVTERIRLATTILQLPNRNEMLVAKQLAVIDRLSNGRLDFGTAVGGRPDDFEVLGASIHGRGQRFESQLARILQVWSEARQATEERGVLGPAPLQQPHPPIWIGGMTEATIRRAVRLGDGFIFGTAGPEQMAKLTPMIREWARAEGKERFYVAALAYAGIGDNPREALEAATRQVIRYYGQLWTAPENLIHHGPPAKIAEDLQRYRQAGIDELIVFLEIPDRRQLDLFVQARDQAQLQG